ncbi:uncharacterized protein LOC131207903 [Anopheles bellator]|uniref:uncharacterized protein LOC131207903 n=1 Tax=Anopheles bellator TaxID=139047 RepID=UPI002647DDCF|nr:uncharacterized protein LOC131207903 [Anopheles bellator]
MAHEVLPTDQLQIRTQRPPPPKVEDCSRESYVRCVRPLYLLSKVFALWCFTVKWKNHPQARQSAFRTSRWCVLHSLVVLMLYSTFHLYTNYADSYGKPKDGGVATESPETTARGEVNFVSVVIDVYNRYSGLVLFWLLHAMAFVRRRTIVNIMHAVQCIDEQFHDRLSIAPDHGAWCRFVCLHIALIFLAIGLCEWYNCVMYISDFTPASEYCIFQCLTTMLTSTTVQIQYVALVQLIKTRLALISRLLVELDDYGREQENARYAAQVRTIQNHTGKHCYTDWPLVELRLPSISESLFGEITPSSSSSCFRVVPTDEPRINTNPAVKRRQPTSSDSSSEPASHPSIARGGNGVEDRRRWHQIKRLKHKIITVDQAPPLGRPRKARAVAATEAVAPGDKGSRLVARQFPLLVASLMNSQSKACDRIRMKIINDIKNLYTHLHLLSLNINQAYGAQLIFILMTLFVTLTTLLYHCTMKLLRMLLLGRHATFETLRPLFWEVLSTLSWICIATVSILRICSVCDSTKNEVRQVGSLIHGLGWNTDCSFTKSTVRTLSLQLLQQRIEFTAGGLFAIDHGLMFNIVAALATFLLILVQFDIAQGGDKWKTLEASARNGTAL